MAEISASDGSARFGGNVTALSFIGNATNADKLGGKLPSEYVLGSDFADLIDLINGVII